MAKIPFGISDENIDPVEYRHGTAASVRECYRVQVGDGEHWVKRPGLTELTTGLAAPVRGAYRTLNGLVLVLSGNKVYQIAADGTATAYSGTANGDGQGVWTEDATHVYLAHGGKLARVSTADKTVSLLGGNSPSGVSHVVYAKGYLLCNGLISGGVPGDTNYSDDTDGGYEASDSWEVFNNEQLPDGCNAVAAGWDAEVYGFGPNSVEVSYNDGTTPWAVLQGARMQYGLLAPYSLQLIENTFYWLTEADGVRYFVKMTNRVPTPISLPYSRLLNEFSTVTDAIAWSQPIRGKLFYIVTFPTEGKTWALKIDDGTWSEFGYWDTSHAEYQRYLGSVAVYMEGWNKVIIGNRKTGTVYTQEGTSDDGREIRLELTSGMMDHGTNRKKREGMQFHRVKRGYGETGSFGFRMRDDNKQWKNEKTTTLGPLGDTSPFVKRPSGGVYRARQYQYIHTDVGSDFIVMGLEAKIRAVE